jgi:hypothetical protein
MFHDVAHAWSMGPARSWCPVIAEPSGPPFVQLPQVMSGKRPIGGCAVPSMREPVRMSCLFGLSVRPFTRRPRSSSADSLVMLAFAECRSSTFLAMRTPFALYQGPLPMRSRACTTFGSLSSLPCVLRYARQVRCPAPAAAASCWQCRSAPSTPPRLPPLPGPTLVMKNDMLFVRRLQGGAAAQCDETRRMANLASLRS